MGSDSFELDTAGDGPNYIIDGGGINNQTVQNELNPGVDRCWGGRGVQWSTNNVHDSLIIMAFATQIVIFTRFILE